VKDFKIILIAFLLGATIFSAVKYVSSLKEKHLFQVSLEEKKTEISALQNEKQNLLQEIGKEKELNQRVAQRNLRLKEILEAGKTRLARLFVKSNRAEEENERLNSQVSILKAESAAVHAEQEKLRLELEQASRENETLSSRLNSLPELKKAIRELKMREGSASVQIDKIEVKKKQITEVVGNRGYIIKDGVPFSGVSAAKVKIEVNPALKNQP
jgi:chromosome segregation ATPase